MVKVENLTKTYDKGSIKALKNINLSVEKGELFGLIGPDGAGKTSLFRILTSLLIPDSGTAQIMNYDCVKDYKEIRKITGYMPGKFSLYQDLSVEENLTFFASVFGTSVEENYYLIKDIYTQIEPFKKRLAGKLSGGMKQKLALSCALIHKPEILILDEPTTGVDAVSRKEFWDMLKKLKKEGITILVSTPYMDEASLCDRIALIQNGEILSINEPQNIINQFNRKLFAIRTSSMYKLMQDLKHFENLNTVFLFGQFVHFTSNNREILESDIYSFLELNNHSDIFIQEIEPTIEDCFMEFAKVENSFEKH